MTALDAKSLKFFETVAQFGSMKRAALQLHTVQSNVTAHIRALEQELNVALFERRTDGIRLTPAGLRLLPHALEVQSAVESAKRAALDDGVPHGALVVGIRKSASTLHLTKLLSIFVPKYPSVELTVRTETSPVLTELVLNRKIEGALICNPFADGDLIGEMMFDEELVVLTPPTVRTLREINPATMQIIVLGQGSLYKQQLSEVLARNGIPPMRAMELGTVSAIIECVNAGLGVTLLPIGHGQNTSYGDAVVHHMADATCRVKTIFVRRRDGFVSSALTAFLNCVREYARG
jgi:DNA-binding transcriptional LysR family regulator